MSESIDGFAHFLVRLYLFAGVNEHLRTVTIIT